MVLSMIHRFAHRERRACSDFNLECYKTLLIEVHLLEHEYHDASLRFFPASIRLNVLYLRVLHLESASDHVRFFNCQE